MGRRIQEMDWTAHPLGPVSRWPRTLRSVLGLMLASRRPMWLGWGRELFFFGNDALLVTHAFAGAADPGSRVREVWGERWSEIRSRVRSVLSSGKPATGASLAGSLDQAKPAWVSEYVPVTDGAGVVAGVLCTLAAPPAPVQPEDEQRFARFMQHLPGLAWIKDGAGRYVFVNAAAAEVFGFSLEQLLGRTDAELFPPEVAARFKRSDRLALSRERGVQFVETLRHPDGRPRHAIVSKFRLASGPGVGPLIGGMAIDITERREAELALRDARDRLEQRVRERTAELEQANARFQAMFDQGVFAGLIALDGTLIDVNRSWLEASGFTAADVLGRPFWAAGWWRGAADVGAWVKIGFGEAMQGERFHGETVYYTAAGEERRLHLALMPIRHEGSGAIRFIVPSGLDITDRYRAEQELRAAELARETEARFRRMADHAPVFVWMTDANNAGSWFNQQWLDFVGRPLERELGFGWMENVHPDDVDRCSEAYATAFAARREFELEFRLRRRDGEFRWILDQGVPTFGPGGEFSGFIGSCVDISERKQAELARQRLAAIVESSDDAIVAMDLDGIITSWNRAAERLFGYTEEQIVGRPIIWLVPPERRADEPGILERIRRGESVHHYETLRRHQDGTLIEVSLSVSPIRDAGGTILGAAKVLRDITSLKQSEAALRRQTWTLETLNRLGRTLAAERDLDQVVQAVTDAGREVSRATCGAFFQPVPGEVDAEGRFRATSGASDADAAMLRSLLGRRRLAPALRGEHAVQISDASGGGSAATGDADTAAGAEYNVLAVPVASRSGAVHGVLLYVLPAPETFSAEVEDVVVAMAAQAAIAIDNVQLYRGMQRELREHERAERALRESEERFRGLADNIAQFAWTADAQGRILWFNRRWFEYTGTNPADMEAWGWRSTHHPDHVDRVLEKYLRCIAAGEIWEDTFPLRRHDGVYRWFLSRAVPIRDAEGRVIQWFGTNTDVTEQREAEFALERARDEAVAASRAKDDFLAALSHELRTPLNPVLLLASDAAENPALPESVRADFETIRKNISLEARLIDDLLDLTRITRGKLLLELESHDVHAILGDAIGTILPEAADKRITLTHAFRAESARAQVDAVRLQQVFWNVLRNAVKFTPAGGRIRVVTRTSPSRDRIQIVVADTGIGLKASEMLRIFDAFSQGDHAVSGEPHRFGGLGLGLAISKMVVEMHAGTIAVSSPGPGQGSTFIIELPFSPPAAARDASVGIAPGAIGGPSAAVQAGLRILLVEDHEPTRRALERLLRRRGFEVAPAGSLAQARELARASAYDLLVSDVGLPDGSGCDLMRELRAAYGLKGIALTGYGMEQDIVRSRAAGFASHLTKPVAVHALDRAISEVTAQEHSI